MLLTNAWGGGNQTNLSFVFSAGFPLINFQVHFSFFSAFPAFIFSPQFLKFDSQLKKNNKLHLLTLTLTLGLAMYISKQSSLYLNLMEVDFISFKNR